MPDLDAEMVKPLAAHPEQSKQLGDVSTACFLYIIRRGDSLMG